MPELPEVERARRMASRLAVGRTIVHVSCAHDPIVFEGVSEERIKQTLSGRTVHAAHRRGKHFWLTLDRRPWPCFHLGMTGDVRTRTEAPIQLESSPAEPDNTWPPRFTKIHLTLDDGGELALTNKRRLGRIRLREDPVSEPPISALGFDPLLDLPSPKRFAELLTTRSAVIKSLLLDQGFAAGVGNWIADEVLYQSGIDPRRRAHALSCEESKRLRTRLKRVIETAVEADADKSRFPRGWLFHQRWGRHVGARVQNQPIEHLTIGGRTTAWVPSVQR
jgi:formamidopyrimidine-DNA glycosylase